MRITLPSEKEQELVRRFTVTLHYLRHLELFFDHRYGSGDDLLAGLGRTLRAHRPYLKLQRLPQELHEDQLRRHLEIAWISELQLATPAYVGQGLALRYTNAWAPVHAYYASYMLLQAWFDANSMRGLADDHAATLKSIASQIAQRRLLPEPWSVLCEGNAIAGTCTYLHEPRPGECESKIAVLSIPLGLPGAYSESEFWARMGTWLRTTRSARLRVKEEEWKKKHGRKRMDPKVREGYGASLHATSLFECLWRLRIRSNYHSVETYLARFIGDDDVKSFYSSLLTITRANAFLLECFVARVVGAAKFRELATDFLQRDSQGLSARTLGSRVSQVVEVATTPGGGLAKTR